VLGRDGSVVHQLEGLNADNTSAVEAILATVAQG